MNHNYLCYHGTLRAIKHHNNFILILIYNLDFPKETWEHSLKKSDT